MRCSQRTLGMRPRKDHRDVDLISDALPFGRLWYGGPNAISNAVGYAEFRSRRKIPSEVTPKNDGPTNRPRVKTTAQGPRAF